MAELEIYPENERFAVLLHEGTPNVPDGWVKEMQLLHPSSPATDQLPEIPAAKCPDGYIEMTGAELNAHRARLWSKMRPQVDAAERERAEEVEKGRIDLLTQNSLRTGFEWRGNTFSLSPAAQLNVQRAAVAFAAGAESRAFPTMRPSAIFGGLTNRGEVIVSAADFPSFFEAFDEALEIVLSAGREAKAALI